MIRSDILFPTFKLPNGNLLSDTDMEHLGRLFDPKVVTAWVAKEKIRIRDDRMWQWGYENFFNEDGSHWEMSPGELAIFREILLRKHKWLEVVSCTQYGKTQTISRAVLARNVTYPGEVLLCEPDQKRGRIFLNYMIQDTAKNEMFANKLEGMNVRKNDILLRLLTERSKVKLTYQILNENGEPAVGSTEIITCEASRRNNAVSAIMGFGGRTIIADEAALEDDEIDSAIFRMLAGKGQDTFLAKISNPFFRNHFLADWKNPKYYKIFIDYIIALAEGRYNQEFIDEAMTKPNAKVFYLCEFPEQGVVDSEGWMMLMTDEDIKRAMQQAPHFGEERMGCDVADEGNDESAIVKRSSGYAEILFRSGDVDTLQFAGQIYLDAEKVRDKRIYIDRVGVGASVPNLVKQASIEKKKELTVVGLNAGETADDQDRFYNKRAEMYWRLREWIMGGGRLNPDPVWYELAKIPYRADVKGRIQIMPKKDMRKKGIPSPNVADALSLTFYDRGMFPKMSDTERDFYRRQKINQRKMHPRGSYGVRYTGH